VFDFGQKAAELFQKEMALILDPEHRERPRFKRSAEIHILQQS
jgi:hypothetical protein